LDSFLKHFLRIPQIVSISQTEEFLMAGKFSIYKYVKLRGKGWRYARAAFHSNGKIKPNIVIVKGANGKATEKKHAEGAYFLNFNNTWIPVGADALEAQHQRKVKLNQVEHQRLSGKTAAPGPNLVQLGRKVIKDEVDGATTVVVDPDSPDPVPRFAESYFPASVSATVGRPHGRTSAS
jgi:hypothetical protein